VSLHPSSRFCARVEKRQRTLRGNNCIIVADDVQCRGLDLGIQQQVEYGQVIGVEVPVLIGAEPTNEDGAFPAKSVNSLPKSVQKMSTKVDVVPFRL